MTAWPDGIQYVIHDTIYELQTAVGAVIDYGQFIIIFYNSVLAFIKLTSRVLERWYSANKLARNGLNPTTDIFRRH